MHLDHQLRDTSDQETAIDEILSDIGLAFATNKL
jgi:hypothetical protein